MKAIPLVARGRGVAALYVDGGTSDRPVNIEALEMLVRVAGLTVELLASNLAARPQVATSSQPSVQQQQEAAREPETEFQEQESVKQSFEPQEEIEYQTESVPAYEVETFDNSTEVNEPESVQAEVVESFESAPEAVEQEPVEENIVENFQPETDASGGFEFSSDYEPEVQHFEDADVIEPSFESNGAAPVEGATQPEPSRFSPPSTRRVDLPIEVSDEERGTHTKARRFARLLVSEIKLYNEDKVKQGREAGDLYGRLKEAIDRSREMYDKRVEPPVSSKFDYFHYELVNDLAEGDPNRLGNGYPGAAV